jgi:hypothetical protein
MADFAPGAAMKHLDVIGTLARLTHGKNGKAAALASVLSDDLEGAALLGEVLKVDPNPDNPPPPRFAVYTARDALQPQPPIEWIIERLFSAGSVSLLFGEGGTKKTWAALDAAVCVALGKQWLDLATLQSTVLIVDEESGKRRISRRLAEVLRGHLAEEDTPLYYTTLERLDLRNPADVAALRALIIETGARFIIIDAMADVMPGADENTVKDMQPVFLALRRIAEETQTAIVMIHHANKSGGYRGSTAIKGAVDLMLLVESRVDSTNIDFDLEKPRDTEPFKFAAVAHFADGEFYLTPSTPSEPVKHLSKSQDYVIRYLTEHGDSPINDVESHADSCSSNAARQAVYALVKMGRVKRVDDGGKGQVATYGLLPLTP